jgi:hypothetical protein
MRQRFVYPRQSFVPWRRRLVSAAGLLAVVVTLGVLAGLALSPLVRVAGRLL